MIKNPRDFDGALKGFTEIVEKVKQAKSMPEVSDLERQGRNAMREVQISAGYIGYRLKEAVDEARARINKELWAGIHDPQPVEKPVEKSQQSVEKSASQTVQSVKDTKEYIDGLIPESPLKLNLTDVEKKALKKAIEKTAPEVKKSKGRPKKAAKTTKKEK